MHTSSTDSATSINLSLARQALMEEHLERVERSQEALERELQNYGAYNALQRSKVGRSFINCLLVNSYISSVLRHIATECAAQDFWHYTPSTANHFRAIELAQREITKMVSESVKHSKAVADSKRVRDKALAALTDQAV